MSRTEQLCFLVDNANAHKRASCDENAISVQSETHLTSRTEVLFHTAFGIPSTRLRELTEGISQGSRLEIGLHASIDGSANILRQFDLNLRFGPSLGISRIQRWCRADDLGLQPPKDVKRMLDRSIDELFCIFDHLPRFGPHKGITRIERLCRAERLGLHPPEDITIVLEFIEARRKQKARNADLRRTLNARKKTHAKSKAVPASDPAKEETKTSLGRTETSQACANNVPVDETRTIAATDAKKDNIDETKKCNHEDATEKMLLQFDNDVRYGPRAGISRLARWRRAVNLGIHLETAIGQIIKADAEGILRQFDLNPRYGPFAGITRAQRCGRANELGMNPPATIMDLIKDTPFKKARPRKKPKRKPRMSPEPLARTPEPSNLISTVAVSSIVKAKEPVRHHPSIVAQRFTQKSSSRLDKALSEQRINASNKLDTEDTLRNFDFDARFGPHLGIGRRERWWRSANNGLNPPQNILDILIERAKRELRHFDLNPRHGPYLGLPRVERWKRAFEFGLDPPLAMQRLLADCNAGPPGPPLKKRKTGKKSICLDATGKPLPRKPIELVQDITKRNRSLSNVSRERKDATFVTTANEEDTLRNFDLDARFGPFAGIGRRQRCWRSANNGLNPPRTILDVLNQRAEKDLRQFDLNPRYGPYLEIPRIERWQRALDFGLEPPLAVRNLLLECEAGPPKKRKHHSRVTFLDSSDVQLQKKKTTSTVTEVAPEVAKPNRLQNKVAPEQEKHPDGTAVVETALRNFDLDARFGPHLGIGGRERWWRSANMGLSPPKHILGILNKFAEKELRQFDLNPRYGPHMGIPRIERWQRALDFGLEPLLSIWMHIADSEVGPPVKKRKVIKSQSRSPSGDAETKVTATPTKKTADRKKVQRKKAITAKQQNRKEEYRASIQQ